MNLEDDEEIHAQDTDGSLESKEDEPDEDPEVEEVDEGVEEVEAAKIIDQETGEEVEVEDAEEDGPLAIPFGPFIVLAALEHFYLGSLLPDSWSGFSMYFY